MATLLELAKLSRAVYDPDDDSRIPPGWEPHGASSHHEWEQTCAFHGQAYRKSSAEVVISFRGTIKKLRNFISDARLSLGFTHQGEEYAIAYAIEVLKRLRAEYGDRPLPTLTVTGHSLGGNLAQVVTAFFQNGGELPRGFNSELAKKVKADFQELAESIHMPAVTFQAPGVAKTYIAEGKDGSHYDGLHLYNPNDLVRLGGSVNIGVQAKLPMARREFKSVAPTVPDQASDTLNITSTSHSAIMESTEASPQSSAPASPWASRTPSVVSLSKLSTSAASASWSVVEGVSGAVSATAKTAVTFIPAHKIAATIEILEAQPAIGNLTPQQYKDLMARPEHLDLLRTITPAQYEVIPYHKSALLKALREDNLDASEISIVVDGLKRLMALEPEQTTLRNKGRARLIAWQEPWTALKDGVGAMDSTAFETLAVLRKTLNEHRRELHELGKGLKTWLNANQDRISANESQLLQEDSKAHFEVDNTDCLRLIADLKTENEKLSEENQNLSKAIDTAYKEAVLDAELVNNKLQELGESIGLPSTTDPLQSDSDSQSADARELRSIQARQIQMEQESIRSELANLRKEHARSQVSPSHLAEFENQSRRVIEGGPDAWMQRELRREQLSLLQKLAQADSGWSLTAVATTQALLKEMAQTREEISQSIKKVEDQVKSNLTVHKRMVEELAVVEDISPLSALDELQLFAENLNATTTALKTANDECLVICNEIMSDLRTVKQGLTDVCTSISERKKTAPWISDIALRIFSAKQEAASKALKTLNDELIEIDIELSKYVAKLAVSQVNRETIDSQTEKSAEFIQPIERRLAQASDSQDSLIDDAAFNRTTQLTLRPGSQAGAMNPNAQATGLNKRERSGSLEIPITPAQRKALDDEFKGGWFAEFGRGQQAKDRARAIDPPECKPGCTKETLETLRSAFFVARPGTERGGEKTKTKLLYAVADDMPDDKKADIVNGESVSFTIGRRSNSKTRGH